MVWIQVNFLDNGLVVWKSHHSLGDGMSCMAMNLQLADTYDTSKLLPFKEITFWQRCMIRAMTPFYLPIILWEKKGTSYKVLRVD